MSPGLIVSSLFLLHGAQQTPQEIRDRFVERVAECGVAVPFTPSVSVQTEHPVIFYSPPDRTVFYPVWSGEDPTRRLMQTEGEASAKAWFDDSFLSLLIPHELGHWLETINDRHIDHWSSELQANRIALAYWRLETADDAALHRRLVRYWAPLAEIPSPVPEGHTPADWFNTAPFDPATYGWYQGQMMQQSWAERDASDFCGLVAQAWQHPLRTTP